MTQIYKNYSRQLVFLSDVRLNFGQCLSAVQAVLGNENKIKIMWRMNEKKTVFDHKFFFAFDGKLKH